MRCLPLRVFIGAGLLAVSAAAWSAGQVTISGELTSFQSALSPYVTDGNGSLNGEPLVIDVTAPAVFYPGDAAAYTQSTTVMLPAGTNSARFEYSDLIGTGNENANLIAFQAATPSTVNIGDSFKVGTITYTNGFWYPFARVGLRIDVVSADPALDGHSFVGAIAVAVSSPTPFVPDPDSNADYFYLDGAAGALSSLGSVRVYEKAYQPASNPGNTGTVDLYATIGSLIPQRFDNPSAGAFLSSSLDPLPAVPEPSTYALLLGGLAAMAGLVRRRRT